MTEKTVVLYPSLGVGHLNPMAQLAKAILRHGGVAVTIVVVDPPEKHAVLAAALARLATVNPSITVHLLPIPSCASKQHSHPIVPILDALRTANPALRAFLASRVPAVDALVVDMFCTDALDVAAELTIPAYFFYPSAAGDLAVYLQIPDLCGAGPSSLKDMGKAALNFAGVPAVRALDMPDTMQDWESDVGSIRLRQLARMPEAAGILVNSFEWLESRALKALRDGHCLPGRSTPKIYCVGPLVDGGDAEGNGERHTCLEWMDGQPRQSVVFLCFGSLGAFSAAQLKETARGLERSGHRFLWAVRSRSSREEQNSREPDLQALLPDGFLERTRGRGLVLKNWAPQTQVLRHEAVGAFVTHCGWNSVLEAVMSGVPMICWPLYAEQRLNKVHVVEEMKVGVVMEGYDEKLVTADEVEAKVRLVMESEEGKKLRERTAMAKEMAADAIKDGGSSHVELGCGKNLRRFRASYDVGCLKPRHLHMWSPAAVGGEEAEGEVGGRREGEEEKEEGEEKEKKRRRRKGKRRRRRVKGEKKGKKERRRRKRRREDEKRRREKGRGGEENSDAARPRQRRK